jgi:hypothetical protein
LLLLWVVVKGWGWETREGGTENGLAEVVSMLWRSADHIQGGLKHYQEFDGGGDCHPGCFFSAAKDGVFVIHGFQYSPV